MADAAETSADLVAAEDVLLFVNAAITATGQREFRSTAGEQQLSLSFLHEYVCTNYRTVYAAALALDINDHNAAGIIERLLRTAGDADRPQKLAEGRLIAARLASLPPQRVYRLFRALRTARVNNRRTRAIQRDWLRARPDLGHDAVKYRSGLRAAARHTHLSFGEGPWTRSTAISSSVPAGGSGTRTPFWTRTGAPTTNGRRSTSCRSPWPRASPPGTGSRAGCSWSGSRRG